MKTKSLTHLLTLGLLSLIAHHHSHAAGTRIAYVDPFATARGNAFTATANNASAVFYNAAGLTQTEGTQTQANAFSISLDYQLDSSVAGRVDMDDDFQTVPSLFLSHKLKNQPLAFGFGAYAPFALGTNWGINSTIGQSILPYKADLQYIKYHFVAAWQITEQLSIAGGLSYDTSKIEILSGPAGILGSFDGDDQTIGHSLSALWKPHPQHAFGLNYQGRTKVKYKGTWTFDPTTQTTASMTQPESIVAGYAWTPSEKWNLEFNLDWTNWDVVNNLQLNNPNLGAVPVPLNWQSAFIWEAGITRYFDNGLHLSGGYTFVENAIPDADLLPIVPDADRHFVSLGLGGNYHRFTWQLTYQLAIDSGRTVNANNYGINGTYELDSQAIAASLAYRW